MRTRSFSAALLTLLFGFASTAAAQQFLDAHIYPLPFLSKSVAAGDFNGDGYPDLAFGYDSFAPAIGIELNKGNGTYRQGQQINSATQTGYAIVTGDWNGDGILDLASGSFVGT